TYPAQATWQGGLVAPAYGLYTLQIQGGEGQAQIDGRVALDTKAGAGSALPAREKIDLVLAKGMHDVRLTGTLADANARLALLWGTEGTTPAAVAPNYLFRGPTGGVGPEILHGGTTPPTH